MMSSDSANKERYVELAEKITAGEIGEPELKRMVNTGELRRTTAWRALNESKSNSGP